MQEKEYHNSQHHNSQYYKFNVSNLDVEIENHWSPYIEKELLAEIKASTINRKNRKNPQKSQLKALSLLALALGLLSIGICLQADSIAQALRRIARISVEQTIQIHKATD